MSSRSGPFASGTRRTRRTSPPRPPPPATATSAQASVPNGRKRFTLPPSLPVLGGKVDSWKEHNSAFMCPICFETMSEPHITQCGHTYCHGCIVNFIEQWEDEDNVKCPRCSALVSKVGLIPNALLNQLIMQEERQKKFKREPAKVAKTMAGKDIDVCKMINSKYGDLKVEEVNFMIEILKRKQDALTVEDTHHQRQLLKDFLAQLLALKQQELDKIAHEVSVATTDLAVVMNCIEQNPPDFRVMNGPSAFVNDKDHVGTSTSSKASSDSVGFNIMTVGRCAESDPGSMAARKRRMWSHFEELIGIYFQSRALDLIAPVKDQSDATVPNENPSPVEIEPKSLTEFGLTLSQVSRYHGLRPLASVAYGPDLVSNSSIVSSIEFDKDSEYFATAGVTKKIKLFEYSTVIASNVDIHCPTIELTCAAKISCIAFSTYYKNKLASSDYEGCVSTWDTGTGARTGTFLEHEKRVWSVDWSNGDPRYLASGSDDTKVKLWSTNQDKSVATLEAKANVCCVNFCPRNSFVLAFGTADHCVHYFDFRYPRKPVKTFIGHNKAVSYVKFASTNELISASTDGCLKLWDLKKTEGDGKPIRSFRGHVNEKNFVGLATDGNFIACGSENNSLYMYYKSLPRPLFHYQFDHHRNVLDRPKTEESTEFVSAVAWKKDSPVIVAANSQGTIKVLELV